MKLKKAATDFNVNQIGIAGGVSANKGLRSAFESVGKQLKWATYIPSFEYCTDNAAMIAIVAHYKFEAKDFVDYNYSESKFKIKHLLNTLLMENNIKILPA
jgi:N6-L-threonylcarbamoyladenine synthase